MYRARLNQDHLSGAAGMQSAMAVKTLQAFLRHPDQHLIVIVRIVGVTAKMGVNAFDAGFAVTLQMHPVAG